KGERMEREKGKVRKRERLRKRERGKVRRRRRMRESKKESEKESERENDKETYTPLELVCGKVHHTIVGPIPFLNLNTHLQDTVSYKIGILKKKNFQQVNKLYLKKKKKKIECTTQDVFNDECFYIYLFVDLLLVLFHL